MRYFLKEKQLNELLINAENDLFNLPMIKFKKCRFWREDNVPNLAGIYAVFNEKGELLYIGESGDMRERMNEINRTVNHSFRKQFGHIKFGGIKSKKKFDDRVETLLDNYFDEKLYVSFLPVNFGRLEIETYLISKHQEKLYNSIKNRK
jgi:hypothetical protein